MNERIKNYLGIAGTAALVVLTILFIIAAYATYTLSRGADPSQYRSFTVSAEGKVSTAPDVARLGFSVVTEGGTDIESLQKDNSKKANDITILIKDAGVADEDIQTTNYSVTPRYVGYRCNVQDAGIKPCPPSEIAGYTIRQSVSVKVRDFGKIGAILSGVVKKGANTVHGPYFSIEDPDKARELARELAIKKARAKADQLAAAGGFRLGKLLSIQEGGGYYPKALRAETFAVDGSSSGISEPPAIEPGSQDVVVTVTLQFRIK